MKNKILLFFILLANLHPLLATTGFVLEWEEVKGATAYQIQVRDTSQNIIIDKKVDKPPFELKNIDLGTYEHRVGVYNKFGKIVSYTEWEPFSILKALSPEITEPKELEFEESQEIQKISIIGKNFEKKMKVSFYESSTNANVLIQQKKILNESEMQIALDMKNYPVGNYNLVLENSRNKKVEIKDFLKVKPKKEVVKKEPPTKKEPPKKEPEVSEPYPYWKEAWQSTYFPGLGQWNKDHKIKAVGFGILLVGSLVYYAATVRDFRSAQKKYDRTVLNSAIFASLFPPQSVLTLTTIATNENAFQRTSYKASLTKQAVMGIWVVYGLNILDALLWKKDSKSYENSETSFFPQFMFYSHRDFYSNRFSTDFQLQWNFRF